MQQYIRTTHANSYRLGIWYGTYRLAIACCLLVIFALTLPQIHDHFKHLEFYVITLIFYTLVCAIQLYVLRRFPILPSRQLFLLSLVDVLCLGCLNLAMGQINLHISLFFVITVFTASLLLNRRQALGITLLSVIIIVYSQFVEAWFKLTDLHYLGTTVLLAFLFFVVHFIVRRIVERFRFMENLNLAQSYELEQLQNINQYILEQIDMGYLVVDQRLCVVLSNPASDELLGISPENKFKEMPLWQFNFPLYQYLYHHQVQQGERFSLNIPHHNTEQQLIIRVQKLTLPQETLTLLTIQHAEKLNQHAQQLKLAALGQLSASIAHEIRNPLASIVQANGLWPDADHTTQNMLQGMIDKQTQRIDKIIQSTLNMARYPTTLPHTIDLKSFIESVVNEDFSIQQNQIQRDVQQNLCISFDESQLRQVLINLIHNALRHNASHATHIQITCYTVNDKTCIDIIDFGNGLPENQHALLFSPFFTTEAEGTGLGLYLSHSFCEANQAKLSYSKLEDGTCFRIECHAIQSI
ncbi:MAG: ATP-binding protein [Acinetobacter sp.]